MSKKYRQYIFYVSAVLTYLVIHEGTHVIQALAYGIFQGLRFNGIGVEVLITEPLTISGLKLACFSGLSSVVTISVGYVICVFTPQILALNNRLVKSYLYYTALVFLLLDPLYIGVVSLFVNGDINGITLGLGLPYTTVRMVYLLVLVINVFFVVKKLYPKYAENFKDNGKG